MTCVDCPVPSGRESSKAWRHSLVPLYDPHRLLEFLFDEAGMEIEEETVNQYWESARARGCPWAMNETEGRIPVKIFGDDCVYDERMTKAYAIVLSLPLWRPKAARNSRFLIWVQKSSQFAGIQGMQPVLARMVWSLNLAYDQPLPKTGLRFCVTEIGGDWAWNRFLWQFARHWNSDMPCPFCDVQKFGPRGYAELPETTWLTSLEFVNEIVGSGLSRRVNALVLLRNFDVSLLQPCQLHNLNLGLLWTSNGGALATFAELGYFGDPSASLALLLETAWDDFVLFMKQERVRCSQSKFTIKMIFKASHGAYFSAKGHNSRVLADWLADCATRAWGNRFGEGRLFGLWLQDRPDQLARALQNEQMAPLCFALFLSSDVFSWFGPVKVFLSRVAVLTGIFALWEIMAPFSQDFDISLHGLRGPVPPLLEPWV